MAAFTKTLKDGRSLVIEIEARPNPIGGGEPYPYLVCYLDGAEVAIGEPWLIPVKERFKYKGGAWLVAGKVVLPEHEAAGLEPALSAAREAYHADETARLETAIPGLSALRVARAERDRYARDFRRMMEDEHNDGVRAPKRPGSDYASLARQYPRAALYLQAEHDRDSRSDAVSRGGAAGMKVLADGGTLDAAREAMAAPVLETAAARWAD